MLALLWYFQQYHDHSSNKTSSQTFDEQKVQQYFKQKQSGKMVKIQAVVTKILSDDIHEPRHQRFIVGLSNKHTVLITHNIDLAPRVTGLNEGDQLEITGQYEWNPQGGVIHWTHHDPNGLRQGGKIIHKGEVYQ